MKIKNEIQKILNDQNNLNNHTVLYLFSKIREFLEANNKKKEFFTLNLYANWLLHSELDKRDAQEIIKNLKKKIEYHFKEGSNINSEIFKTLNLEKLTQELSLVFNLMNLKINHSRIDLTPIFSIVLNELIEKPLRLPNEKIDKRISYPHDIYGIKLIGINDSIHWEILSPTLENMNSRIVGPIIANKKYSITFQ